MKVELPKIDSFEEFEKIVPDMLNKPENTIVFLIYSLEKYVSDNALGTKMLNILKGPVPLNNHDQQFMKDRLYDKLYLPKAYYIGSTPKNNYEPSLPLAIEVEPEKRTTVEAGYVRLFIITEGADNPRPIVLRKKGESYFLWDYASVFLGVKKPAAEDAWA